MTAPTVTSTHPPGRRSPAAGAGFAAPYATETGSTRVSFDWTDVTDPSGVRLYELEIGHNAGFVQQGETNGGRRTLVRATDSWAEVHFSETFGDDVLYWRVRTLDGANNHSSWSEGRRFDLGALGAPRLAATVVTPPGVPGGGTGQGKVLLQGVAPAGGTTVKLSSSDPAVAAVPATVTVPAGSDSVTFAITTKPVTASKAVRVRAELGEEWSAPVLWVDPAPPAPKAKVRSLSLAAGEVAAGKKATATLTLSAPAPAGGLLVKLSADRPGPVRVPASVLVPAGKTGVTFHVETSAVSASSKVRITAALGDDTKQADLLVRPSPQQERISVHLAEYRTCSRELRVEATSSNPSAVLQVLDAATGSVIGTLRREGDGRFRGRFSLAAEVKTLTVRSSAASATVATQRNDRVTSYGTGHVVGSGGVRVDNSTFRSREQSR